MASTCKLGNRKCLFLIPGVNELRLKFGSVFRVTCEGLETPTVWGKAMSVLFVTTTVNSGAQREHCREAEKESVQAGQDRWGAEGGEGTVNLKRKL